MSDDITTFRELLQTAIDLGAKQKQIAVWLKAGDSSLTRWLQGVKPDRPIDELVKLLAPQLEKLRVGATQRVASVTPSWPVLLGDADEWFKHFVYKTGILASTYTAVVVPILSTFRDGAFDCAVVRFCHRVFGDAARRRYQVGDLGQTLSQPDQNPEFLAVTSFGGEFRPHLEPVEEVGTGKGHGVFRVRFPVAFSNAPEGPGVCEMGSFGYGYVATRALQGFASETPESGGFTCEFLGTSMPIASKRIRLVVFIPRASLRGSPSALTYHSRNMLKYLAKYDEVTTEERQALLWPQGTEYKGDSAPDSALTRVEDVEEAIEPLPGLLRDQMRKWPCIEGYPESMEGIILDPEHRSNLVAYVLDLRYPVPTLNHTIVWRLQPRDHFEAAFPT